VSAPQLWPRFIGGDDDTLIGCPRCAEGLMRWTDTRYDRSGTVHCFICTVCETRGELDLEVQRVQTRIAWKWAPP
jgi:hypothetical protein